MSCLVLSCLVLSCLVLPCLVLSCLVLSCLVLSCLVLSAHQLPLYTLRPTTYSHFYLRPQPPSIPWHLCMSPCPSSPLLSSPLLSSSLLFSPLLSFQSDVMFYVDPSSPQYDSHSYWRYYIFPVLSGHEILQVRLKSLVGSVDLYAARCASKFSSDCVATSLPNMTNYIVTTFGELTDDVDIARQDDQSCSYILAVHCNSYYVAYQLSVTLSDTILALMPGSPVTDHVSKGGSDYFSFALTGESSTLRIVLQSLSGDADLYVSTHFTHPNAVNRCTE